MVDKRGQCKTPYCMQAKHINEAQIYFALNHIILYSVMDRLQTIGCFQTFVF